MCEYLREVNTPVTGKVCYYRALTSYAYFGMNSDCPDARSRQTFLLVSSRGSRYAIWNVHMGRTCRRLLRSEVWLRLRSGERLVRMAVRRSCACCWVRRSSGVRRGLAAYPNLGSWSGAIVLTKFSTCRRNLDVEVSRCSRVSCPSLKIAPLARIS